MVSILRFNKRSLAVIHALAMLLRDMVCQFIDNWDLVFVSPDKVGTDKVRCGSVRFSDLLPAPTTASKILVKMTSAMNKSMYYSLHVAENEWGRRKEGDMPHDDSGDGDGREDGYVDGDESDVGVARIG